MNKKKRENEQLRIRSTSRGSTLPISLLLISYLTHSLHPYTCSLCKEIPSNPLTHVFSQPVVTRGPLLLETRNHLPLCIIASSCKQLCLGNGRLGKGASRCESLGLWLWTAHVYASLGVVFLVGKDVKKVVCGSGQQLWMGSGTIRKKAW